MPEKLDILVLGDLHFIEQARQVCPYPERRGEFGALFLRKALHRLRHQGVQPDLLVVLGDLVDNGAAEGADADLATLAAILRETQLPTLVIPGNHDGSADAVRRAFGTAPGLHVIGGYGFLVFEDAFEPHGITHRPSGQASLAARTAAAHPDLPLIAVQHNPIYPPIESSYPYVLQGAEEVMRAYERAGVFLSLSGHFHAGAGPVAHGGVTYLTVPALCESPFGFAHIRLSGRRAEVRRHALRMDAPGLLDVHCHTEYAYCGTSVSAARCLAVSEALGLERVCLTEHTFQLYFGKDDAWSFRWQTDEAMVERAWRERDGRMDGYRRFIEPLRGPRTLIGLEVDLLANGNLLLAPQDRKGWDVIVGAAHAIPGVRGRDLTQAQAEELFMRDTARLVEQGVDVLAHPFRYFRRANLEHPTRLHGEVAALLARAGVAAEVNFHIDEPAPAFLAECVRRGVRLALGSDSHDLVETGEFWPHLAAIERAGITRAQLPGTLYRPGS